MARYNCLELGCNVYFDNDLDSIVSVAINHAFGSHQKIIDREAVVGVIKGQAQAGQPLQQEPIPVEKSKEELKAARKKRRIRRKRKKAKLLKMEIGYIPKNIKDGVVEEAELVEVSVPEGSILKPKNKIFDWWKNKG